ncbi:hypothetical protein FB451DRAFT_1360692 [Mycena latifolia]|nr:hypothetical protein FB451DRAFT_1360692 [Mycena latifolia]
MRTKASTKLQNGHLDAGAEADDGGARRRRERTRDAGWRGSGGARGGGNEGRKSRRRAAMTEFQTDIDRTAHHCTSLVCRRITLRTAADVRAAPSEQLELEGSGVRERTSDVRGVRRAGVWRCARDRHEPKRSTADDVVADSEGRTQNAHSADEGAAVVWECVTHEGTHWRLARAQQRDVRARKRDTPRRR